MVTSYERKTAIGVVRRVGLAGCMILVGACLALGLDPARTTGQPPVAAPKGEKPASKRLNHIDLVVANVKENKEFFEKHFGFKSIVVIGDDLAVLTDGTDFSLVFSSPEVASEIDQVQRNGKADPKDKGPGGVDAKKPIEYPKGFHVGFHQDSKEAVDEMYKKLKDAGVAVQEPKDYHGAWTFYVKAPGGYFVEVFHQSRRGDRR